MKEGKLEIGDRLYSYGQWGGMSRYKVVRLTPKRAVLDNGTQVSIELTNRGHYHEGELSAKIHGDYGHYTLENDRVLKDYNILIKRRKLKKILEAINWDKLTDDKLDAAIAAITPFVNREILATIHDHQTENK